MADATVIAHQINELRRQRLSNLHDEYVKLVRAAAIGRLDDLTRLDVLAEAIGRRSTDIEQDLAHAVVADGLADADVEAEKARSGFAKAREAQSDVVNEWSRVQEEWQAKLREADKAFRMEQARLELANRRRAECKTASDALETLRTGKPRPTRRDMEEVAHEAPA